MNTKKAKAIRRMMKKQRNDIVKEFLYRLKSMPFTSRFKIAWMLLFPKKEKQSLEHKIADKKSRAEG